MPLNRRCPKSKFDFARKLRQRMTHTERMLWGQIRRQALGARFRRQSVILGYIADFYCPSRRLAVEVDGGSHRGRRQQDAERDRVFDVHGIKTVRLTADEVFNDVKGCAQQLRALVDKIPPFRSR